MKQLINAIMQTAINVIIIALVALTSISVYQGYTDNTLTNATNYIALSKCNQFSIEYLGRSIRYASYRICHM